VPTPLRAESLPVRLIRFRSDNLHVLDHAGMTRLLLDPCKSLSTHVWAPTRGSIPVLKIWGDSGARVPKYIWAGERLVISLFSPQQFLTELMTPGSYTITHSRMTLPHHLIKSGALIVTHSWCPMFHHNDAWRYGQFLCLHVIPCVYYLLALFLTKTFGMCLSIRSSTASQLAEKIPNLKE